MFLTGRSHLHFQGNKVWVDHKYGSWDLPGVQKPMLINGTSWTPTLMPGNSDLNMARDMGGQLACVETKEEAYFINTAIRDRILYHQKVAIGGLYESDNSVTSVDGKKAEFITKWSESDPAVSYIAFSKYMQWQTIGKDELCYAFVCEFAADAEVKPIPQYLTMPTQPTSKPTSPKATPVVTAVAKIELKSNTSKLISLLVVPLGDHRYAGLASKLSISALPHSEKETVLEFNQEVGDDMKDALEEVIRFLRIRQLGWPEKSEVQLAFAEKYSPKDGPSAAVATALLMESLITGQKLDPNFAVTGDMNAAGDVQPIGGVSAKLRGAKKGGANVVAIPFKNRIRALDLAMTDGIKPLLDSQIFTIKTFDEAWNPEGIRELICD